MYTQKELQTIITSEIDKLNFNQKPIELYEPITYSLSVGGKRIRPVLALMACNLFNDEIQKAIKPGLGVEIFHNFTLLHDDIMDNASIRRNMPTVHKKWDENVAILSGDAMMIKAYDFLLDLEPDLFKEIFKVFNQTALEVCEGQQYDMNFETRDNVTVDEYLEMIKLKTSVLLAASLKIGALIGGASKADANTIYDLGLNVGLAFQLQDDLLDVYGDVDVFGKKNGGDITSNKKTFLLIKTLELAKGELLENLNKELSKKEFNQEEKIEAVTNIYNEVGVKEISVKKMNDYFDTAFELLEKVNVEESRKEELKQFALKIKNRVY